MKGISHCFVANLALASLEQKERHILFPRWGGIESGATLSDDFKIMWERESLQSDKKQLVHRCYIDSNDSKNHGCVTRAYEYADGSIDFINTYNKDPENSGYTEDSFLENLGMFLGVISHHISDLCTPVHVGNKIDYKALGFPSLTHFHNKVEKDILLYERDCDIKFPNLRLIEINREYFWNIAKDTYDKIFLNLSKIYSDNSELGKIKMTADIIGNAVRHTAIVWHTILTITDMTDKKWSMQPLL